MDCLDYNLHSSILTALASNLASSSTQDDLALLTDSFSQLEPVTNGVVNGVLARLGVQGDTPGVEVITQQQAEAIIAYAEFATTSSTSDTLPRCLTLLRSVTSWEVEANVGLQACDEWAPADGLCFALVKAVLVLASEISGERTQALRAISDVQMKLLKDIATAPGYRVIGHLLPTLNGLRRAFSSSSFPWTHADSLPAAFNIETATLSHITDSLSSSWDPDTLQGRTSLSTITRYSTSLKGLSAGMVPSSLLECHEAVLLGIVSRGGTGGWKGIIEKDITTDPPSSIVQKTLDNVGDEAVLILLETVAMLEDEERTDEPDPYSFDILESALKVATLASIASSTPNEKIFGTIEGLLTETSIITDSSLQSTATECLQALAHAFPNYLKQCLKVIRRFVLSPSAVFESNGELSSPPALTAAATCYASLISLTKDPGMGASVIQSLFNHFTDQSGDVAPNTHPYQISDSQSIRSLKANGTRTESQKTLVSVNVVHAVSTLAQEFENAEVYSLVVGMLLQRLRSSSAQVDGAIMYELGLLAQYVDASTFQDISSVLSTVSKTPTQDEVMNRAILAAQTRLATSAATKPEFQESYLTGILSLIVDKGSAKGSSKSELAQVLLDLVPVLDTFFLSANLDPHREVTPDLVALFRSTWYLFVLSGFLSTPARIADWQRSALMRIAKNTPGLLMGARHDFIETQLEYNTVLKHSGHVMSSDAIRSEFATAVPSQAGHVRTLSAPQVIFLTTVLRLETLRAEAGDPSVVLSYFFVEGVNESPLFTTLSSIANEVNTRFISHFSQLVTSSSINDDVYAEIRRIVLLCSHSLATVRKASLRHLNDLVTSFPSLICNASIVTVILELLTVLRRACQAEFLDEYTPIYSFHSVRADFTLVLPDDYPMRNSVLTELHQYSRAWLKAALTRAPYEMQGLLQDYIGPVDRAEGQSSFLEDDMGKSVAIDMTRMLPANDKGSSLPPWGGWKSDNSAQFAKSFGTRTFYGGEAHRSADAGLASLTTELDKVAEQVRAHKAHFKLPELRSLLYRAAAYLVNAQTPQVEILRKLVSVPTGIFSEGAIAIAQEVWTWVADSRPDLETRLMVEVAEAWTRTIELKQGFFSSSFDRKNPLDEITQFSPTSKDDMTKEFVSVSRLLHPHSVLLSFLSSRFQAFRYRNRDLVETFVRLLLRSVAVADSWSTHQLTREPRLRLVSFGFCVLQGSQQETAIEAILRNGLYDAALSWFAISPGWSFGSNRIQLKSDLQAVEDLAATIKNDVPSYRSFATSQSGVSHLLPNGLPVSLAAKAHASRQQLLLALLDNEADRLRLWINPLMDSSRGPLPGAKQVPSEAALKHIVAAAWACNPAIAVHLPERLKTPSVDAEVTRLVRSDPGKVEHVSDALSFFVGTSITPDVRGQLKHLLYWAPVPVSSALRFLFPKFGGDAILLQYALRVLEHHPVEVTFFYIPQVVQSLRTDRLGYAERFIFETSKISQLFCHQIIWNMKANAYRGDDGEEPDPMKPTLDRMIDMIVASLSGDAKDFYQREFAFFDEVTSISAKLKPFIKSSKLEKKAKIDEEMAKIKVDPGVYLPSNPDGVVVDIDRLSGRPLQSHAKAPFMATFKVRRERKTDQAAQDALIEREEGSEDVAKAPGFDTWQSAIFKVGDDCRQDVLALQIIAMHKNIFTSLGLDLLVTPYRVTATGPGCGVIDVVPNATSRDEMGRAKVNDLRSFFIMKYGSPDSVHFQKARINFIQSMAAYSLLCYIVQIKDRHNGNIMIDGHGCITHIDFGFLFDIGPGGVKFEPSSFKLSHEMVVLMGGRNSVGFRMFSELTVKAFLACRPYGQAVVDTSTQMMDAGFPSYKGEATMTRLKERFRLDLTEKAAAEYMKGIIANACENPRSIVYDEFQRATNGIPYVR